MDSSETFDQAVAKSQIPGEEDTGSLKFMKKVTEFETKYVPVLLPFALCFLIGASYSFSMVLYFLVLVPLVLFNVMGLHKKCFTHKVFRCFFDNLWLILGFFWFINLWTIEKYYQPYYIGEVK